MKPRTLAQRIEDYMSARKRELQSMPRTFPVYRPTMTTMEYVGLYHFSNRGVCPFSTDDLTKSKRRRVADEIARLAARFGTVELKIIQPGRDGYAILVTSPSDAVPRSILHVYGPTYITAWVRGVTGNRTLKSVAEADEFLSAHLQPQGATTPCVQSF